jgi:hypothetical protein
VLAAFTAWPPIYMLLFIAFIGVVIATDNGDGAGVGPAFGVVVAFHLATMLLMLALTVIYVLHALRSGTVPQDQRLLWVVILFVGNVIAMPIYWWLYVWKEGDRAVSDQQHAAVPPART